MDSIAILTAVLATLVVIAILYALAGRVGVPYPTVFVLGGLVLALIPGLPTIALEPDLVLLLFLPPLLFIAATETPTRELRAYIVPIARLAIVLVLLTMAAVALVANAMIPTLGWAAAFTLGAILAPTDAIAAASVFKRLGVPRLVTTLIDGESLFNDATALVAYRAGVIAAASGTFVLANAATTFVVAALGGIAIGLIVGAIAVAVFERLDDPAVEVVLSMVVPFAAYLPAEYAGLSGVLAAVTAGLVIGSRLGKILSARTRVLWISTWQMIGFVFNGFVFVLVGLQLPHIGQSLQRRDVVQLGIEIVAICAVVVGVRFAYVFSAARVFPNNPARLIARTDARLASRLTLVVGWAGMRGSVSLAAALALPAGFPERDVILLATFAVILVTLVGQGLTLPAIVRRANWDGREIDGDEMTMARQAAYQAGLTESRRLREVWNGHQPLFDRLEAGLVDRTEHLATDDEDQTAERRQERLEHEQILLGIISAQRNAVIELRDSGEINDDTLRQIERELDLEELRMEG